jgi:hypothetical protein
MADPPGVEVAVDQVLRAGQLGRRQVRRVTPEADALRRGARGRMLGRMAIVGPDVGPAPTEGGTW